MGIVIRQSLKATISSYLGILLGFANVIFLYPKFLDASTIGLIETIKAIVLIITPFSLFGFPAALTRFFPVFTPSGKDNGFYFTMGLIMFGGFSFFVLFFFFFQDTLIELIGYESDLISEYTWLIIPSLLSWVILHYASIVSHSAMRINIVRILDSIIMRILILVAVILYGYSIIPLNALIIILALVYVIPGFILLGYLFKTGIIKFKVLPKLLEFKQFKEIFKYSSYVIFSMVSGLIVQKIDIIMLGAEENLMNVGIYSIAFYIGTVIEIPMRNISDITFPILSKSFNKNDTEEIEKIYKESSLNQFIIGGFLFIVIWGTVDHVFEMMPNGDMFSLGKYVVFFIGISKVFNMLMGSNKEVLEASKYYRLNLYVNFLLGTLTIAFNVWLIPKYSMNGAAIASLMAIVITNTISFILVKKYLKIQPFTLKTIAVLVIVLVMFGIAVLLPDTEYSLLSLMYKGSILSMLYLSIIYFTKVSVLINKFADQLLAQIGFKK